MLMEPPSPWQAESAAGSPGPNAENATLAPAPPGEVHYRKELATGRRREHWYMTIVHCPRCRDEVTVPAKASPRALVRCPLCLEEYLLAEALAEMPPALLVVGGEMEEEPALVGGGSVAAEAGGDYSLAGDGGYGAGVFDSSAPAGAAVSPARVGKAGAR